MQISNSELCICHPALNSNLQFGALYSTLSSEFSSEFRALYLPPTCGSEFSSEFSFPIQRSVFVFQPSEFTCKFSCLIQSFLFVSQLWIQLWIQISNTEHYIRFSALNSDYIQFSISKLCIRRIALNSALYSNFIQTSSSCEVDLVKPALIL